MSKNKYAIRSRISEGKFREIVRCFAHDFTATQSAKLTGVNRRSINEIFLKIRRRITEASLREPVVPLRGEVESDESYFGPHRVRGKRGRGAGGKIIVFGLLKRQGRVHVQIVPKCTKRALLPIIRGRVATGSTVYTDGWKAYDGLILDGYRHYRIHHSKNEFARGKKHINGIESFWSFAKRRLSKFNGVKKYFPLHLKESEFRFNHRRDNIYAKLLKLLRKYPA